MVEINKSIPTKFELSFPKFPLSTDLKESHIFKLHLISTVLPGISQTALEANWQGGVIYEEGGGVTYDEWSTDFHIDENWENYILLFDWLTSMSDGHSVVANPSGKITANLVVLDNYNKEIVKFKFDSIWPKSLSSINLSYQEGTGFLNCNVTFFYNYFIKMD